MATTPVFLPGESLGQRSLEGFSPWGCRESKERKPLSTHSHLPLLGFPGASDSKESACTAGDLSSIPGWESFPGEGHDCPLQYSCLVNSMDRGTWWAIVRGVSISQTLLRD